MTIAQAKSIFLADDDDDDCLLFQDALREICSRTQLTTAKDGMELMGKLEETVPPPPDVIFLDLNMPRKNGFECLEEIRRTHKLKNIPVVIFSTSAQSDSVDKVYESGANYYVRKPGSFAQLKMAIQQILSINWGEHTNQTPKEKFLLAF
jgi:CheY-like chemotaxis protein